MRARTRRLVAAVAAAAPLFAATACGAGAAADEDTVYFGVSGPKTGTYAYIGEYWQNGFDLAIDEINEAGGIDGRNVELIWEDSQSDPKQTVTIAQKFAENERVIAEIGDFSSNASMAASAVYERAGLVQYAFTASSPQFTDGGEHMFAPQMSQSVLAETHAATVSRLGDTAAVLYLDTDWGLSTFDAFRSEAEGLGLDIVYESAYSPETTDFRPILLQARDAAPEVIVQLGYDDDGAQLIQQVNTLGIDEPEFYSAGLTQVGLDLAGPSAEGVYYSQDWYADAPDERVRSFVTRWQEVHDTQPSNFEAGAYDAIMQLAAAVEAGGPTREGVFEALQETEIPSVRYGPFVFEDDRRPPRVEPYVLQVVDGVPQLADGLN